MSMLSTVYRRTAYAIFWLGLSKACSGLKESTEHFNRCV